MSVFFLQIAAVIIITGTQTFNWGLILVIDDLGNFVVDDLGNSVIP